jgi:peptide/nickel transport system permease protein
MKGGRVTRFRNWIPMPGSVGIFTGTIMFIMLVVGGLIIPNFGPYKANAFVGEPFVNLSVKHPFGLDQLGRDVMTRTFAGVQIDLGIAFLGVSIPFIIGTIVGILLGLAKNRYLISLVGSIIDGVNAFPLLVLAVAMISFFGTGLQSVIIILAITNWARYARIARTRAVVVIQQNYIEAAKTLGYSRWRTVRKHIVPNVSSETIAYALSDFILVIMVVSGLSFLGLAASPPLAEWGSMIAEGRAYLIQAWWITIFPGVALCWAAVSLSFIVEGMSRRDGGM